MLKQYRATKFSDFFLVLLWPHFNSCFFSAFNRTGWSAFQPLREYKPCIFVPSVAPASPRHQFVPIRGFLWPPLLPQAIYPCQSVKSVQSVAPMPQAFICAANPFVTFVSIRGHLIAAGNSIRADLPHLAGQACDPWLPAVTRHYFVLFCVHSWLTHMPQANQFLAPHCRRQFIYFFRCPNIHPR